ncbi:putative Major facilitator superfamily (MFS) profile domain-containing protein [Seiridium cardinale]|uniref:Major facilitator superfamily (MFS) profile domain-containing protein n=1 Tax=Seiridium cardinale TaxID=138064 RepID=A0ABR2XME7_9PEZI
MAINVAATDNTVPTEKVSEHPSGEDLHNAQIAPGAKEDGIHGEGEDPEPEYVTGIKYWLIVFALCLAIFVIMLDGTVIATAAPEITDEFHSLADLGWYSSVYFSALSIAQLLFGKLNTLYSIRWTYTCAMLLFLALVVGSAICGAAPNSPALIVGRAIAGLGCSGLLIGTFSLIPLIAAPLKRPIFVGTVGGVLGLGMSIGPLVGGAFTENVTWRWNFYLNLPVGAVSYLIFFFLVHPPATSKPIKSASSILRAIDLLGLLIVAPCVICLLLALQWGGTIYPWSDGRIIALLVLFGVLGIAFIAVEIWQGDEALLPPRVFTQRSLLAAVFFCFCSSGSSFTFAYYVPIWFQAVLGTSPLQAGVDTLPLVISQTIASVVGGGGIAAMGYIWPFMIASSVLLSVGAGLITTFNPTIPTGNWIGYQILYGLGMGLSAQTPLMVAQNVLELDDIPLGSGMVMFTQTIAGAIFTAVAQALFGNTLYSGLAGLNLPGFDFSEALAGGVTSITAGLTGNLKQAVVQVINTALTHSWRLCVALSCIGMIGSLVLKRQKIRGHENSKKTESHPS